MEYKTIDDVTKALENLSNDIFNVRQNLSNEDDIEYTLSNLEADVDEIVESVKKIVGEEFCPMCGETVLVHNCELDIYDEALPSYAFDD